MRLTKILMSVHNKASPKIIILPQFVVNIITEEIFWKWGCFELAVVHWCFIKVRLIGMPQMR